MLGWWTNLDIEIVCNHGDDMHYIQISSIEDGKKSLFKCPVCGQVYEVELTVNPLENDVQDKRPG